MEGLATDDDLDLDEQIIDKDFAHAGLAKWFSEWANVRQMHSTALPPAGTAVEMEPRPDGIWVRSHIFEPGAVLQVKNGGYKAYSVGISRPRIIRDGVAKNGRVVDGVFSEISLVDFPANPRAKFQLAKRAGSEATAPIEIVEKHIGPELTKAAAVDDGVTIDGHRVTPSDLAAALRKLGKASGAVEPQVVKRDMDPNVGGGVDRDQLKDSDFVFGDERDFPIVTPGDVPDAVSSWGRYKGKHSFDEFKSKLTALARRKGPEFEAKLPKEWKDTSTTKTDEPEVTKTTVEPEVAKGAKDCPQCGKSYHSDTSAKFCENCGTKLPAAAEKVGDTELAKELHAVGDAGMHGAEGLEVLKSEAEVAKAKDTKPGLAEHREPDGDEDGPDVDGDGDGAKPTAEQAKANKSAASTAYHLLRLHDATCAAFHDADVLAAHPALAKGIASIVDPAVFGEMVTKALTEDAGTGTRIDELPGLSEAYGFAVSLKALDPELAEQAMAAVRKSFADEYPDAHPTPTDVEPGKFQRPYISAGRAALSAKAGQKPRIPLASHVPDPGDFQRPLITDGHEATAPASVAKSGRTYYTTAARDQATGVLTAMHDYIAAQHPAVCPMGDTPAIPAAPGGTLNTATAIPSTMDNRATAVPTTAAAPVTKSETTTTEQAEAPVAQAPLDTELVKTVLGDLLAEHLNPINETLAKYDERLVDLESTPDPAQAAVRGSALTALKRANSADETQAGLGNGEAAESLVRLVKRARHPDTSVSVPAIEQLMEQIGDNPAGLTKLLGS